MLAYASFTNKGILLTHTDESKKHYSFFDETDEYICYEQVPINVSGIYVIAKSEPYKHFKLCCQEQEFIFKREIKNWYITVNINGKTTIKSENLCLSKRQELWQRHQYIYECEAYTDLEDFLLGKVTQLGGVLVDGYVVHLPQSKKEEFSLWLKENNISIDCEQTFTTYLYKQRKLL